MKTIVMVVLLALVVIACAPQGMQEKAVEETSLPSAEVLKQSPPSESVGEQPRVEEADVEQISIEVSSLEDELGDFSDIDALDTELAALDDFQVE